MKNKLIVANLKKSMSLEETSTYLKYVNQIYASNLIICPSNIYIPYFLKHGYEVGIQNISHLENCSGEISPRQAYELGLRYVIVGHSDRRTLFHESDEMIHQKVIKSVQSGLHVILCIGETKEDRDLLRTDRVLRRQLELGLKEIEEVDQIIIAYEPVWAIGTSITPSLKDIQKTSIFIKEFLKHKKKWEDVKVLYGGSVTNQNISSILKIQEIDGVLVGKSAVEGSSFLKLLEVAV